MGNEIGLNWRISEFHRKDILSSRNRKYHWICNCFTQGDEIFIEPVFPPGHYPARVSQQGQRRPWRSKNVPDTGHLPDFNEYIDLFSETYPGYLTLFRALDFSGICFRFLFQEPAAQKIWDIIPAPRFAWMEWKMRRDYHIASYGLLRRMMKCEKKKMQLDLDVK